MSDTTLAPDGPRRPFNDNAQEAPRSEAQEPDVATASELRMREGQRATHDAEMHLRIGGTVEQATHTNVETDNEMRIRELHERLNSARNRLAEGQKRGRRV